MVAIIRKTEAQCFLKTGYIQFKHDKRLYSPKCILITAFKHLILKVNEIKSQESRERIFLKKKLLFYFVFRWTNFQQGKQCLSIENENETSIKTQQSEGERSPSSQIVFCCTAPPTPVYFHPLNQCDAVYCLCNRINYCGLRRHMFIVMGICRSCLKCLELVKQGSHFFI